MKAINIKDEEKLLVELEQQQKRIKVRRIDDIGLLKSVCEKTIEALLKMGIYRKDLVGAKFTYVNGYSGGSLSGRKSTFFDFEIRSSGVFVTSIYRHFCDRSEGVDFVNQNELQHIFAKKPVQII
jgi:hypothetical protein